jgi:hypothetical protein
MQELYEVRREWLYLRIWDNLAVIVLIISLCGAVGIEESQGNRIVDQRQVLKI